MDQKHYDDYLKILKEELVPAMGCTEPIAIAYAAALARKELGCIPDKVDIQVSGNIIKNVKSVIVPNTGGLRGIEAAAAAGIVVGDPELELRVIAEVEEKDKQKIYDFLNSVPVSVEFADNGNIFDIMVTLYAGEDSSYIRICGFHTNVVEVRKNEKVLFVKDVDEEGAQENTDRSFITVEEIIEFADTVKIEDVKELLDFQIQCNMEIAEEGLRGNYGANIGKTLLTMYGEDDIKVRARAKAAAGSDARMNGCEMPVVINSGSGNQGITASVPVIEYAAELGVSDEMKYRALVVANLVTIHLKSGIGRLSAYCGAVSAGCGSGAGICYLYGGRFRDIAHTIVNSLAINSGIICDGAKASCAAKIASAVDAGILGYHMFKEGQQFYGGDGIVKKGVENTIVSVGKLAKDGMAETDKEILRIMLS
ncbi:MAG: serine dehydratase subunit alpha family protein [Firmicutes bacterium]|nr:serine dehydratase subunit alpha family protein [Clostridiales bacterium]MBQ4339991.1 serine dehydratase subunit alpha family protein [Bacillota bacterium]